MTPAALWSLVGTAATAASVPLAALLPWEVAAASLLVAAAAWGLSIHHFVRLVAEAGCTLSRSPDP